MNFEHINNDITKMKELFWKCINAIIIFNGKNNISVKVAKKLEGYPKSGYQELYYDIDTKALDFGYTCDFKNEYHQVTKEEKQAVINTYHMINNKLNIIENNSQKKNR